MHLNSKMAHDSAKNPVQYLPGVHLKPFKAVFKWLFKKKGLNYKCKSISLTDAGCELTSISKCINKWLQASYRLMKQWLEHTSYPFGGEKLRLYL